jgi:hypothetical protein
MGCGDSKIIDGLKPKLNFPDMGIKLPTDLKVDLALPKLNIEIPGADLLAKGAKLAGDLQDAGKMAGSAMDALKGLPGTNLLGQGVDLLNQGNDLLDKGKELAGNLQDVNKMAGNAFDALQEGIHIPNALQEQDTNAAELLAA